MVTRGFLRRGSVAALVMLVMVVTAMMACGEKKGTDDNVPLGSESATKSAVPGGTAGANASQTADLTPETQRAIDAGNAAFRAKDYARALTEFENAATLSPQLSAPWFGIYMVAQVRKDAKAADAALVEIRKRGDAPVAAGAKTGTGVTKN